MAQLGMFVRSALAACVLSDRFDSRVARRQRIRALFKVCARVCVGGELRNWNDCHHWKEQM